MICFVLQYWIYHGLMMYCREYPDEQHEKKLFMLQKYFGTTKKRHGLKYAATNAKKGMQN